MLKTPMNACNQLFPASCVLGTFETEWSVKYNQQRVCALKGSTVFINGSFSHPEHLTGIKTFWTMNPDYVEEPTDMSEDPDYSDRVEYFTDEDKYFSLKLSEVTMSDEHHFCFRIKSSIEKQKWIGRPGIDLRVTELNVEIPTEVTEGETAVLTCGTTCRLTEKTFLWYKNGRPLTTKTIKNNQLHLQTVSSEDAGSYSCAVGGYQHLRSTDQKLRVTYPPKNVSVSISGKAAILTCRSDANPPVKTYTWYEDGEPSPVGFGVRYSPLLSGSYYCEAQNEHGAQRSDPVLVNLKGHSPILYAAIGVGLCGIVVFLAVFFWRRRKRQDRNTDEVEYSLEYPHTVPAEGVVGVEVEVEGHQVFWSCDNKPIILVLTTVPPHTDSLGVSTKAKAGLKMACCHFESLHDSLLPLYKGVAVDGCSVEAYMASASGAARWVISNLGFRVLGCSCLGNCCRRRPLLAAGGTTRTLVTH
ncbi:hypothetical protein NFI96_026844 [Prochilodus magdalenae]|nr:hypothetical protein NFI96_026844 [Prochilodus magdalenae]